MEFVASYFYFDHLFFKKLISNRNLKDIEHLKTTKLEPGVLSLVICLLFSQTNHYFIIISRS